MMNRNTTIDIAKGIGAISVVLGHNWLVLGEKSELYRIIYSFHIPLFLFITGLLLKDTTSVRSFAQSRADNLLKPYLVIFLFLSILKLINPIGNPAITVSPVIFFLRALYATPGYIIWEWLPLWYLPHLFITSILSKIFLRFTENSRNRETWIGLIIILCMATGIWLFTTTRLTTPRPPFTFDAALLSLSFILLGFLFRDKVKTTIFNLPAFLITALTFSLLHYFFDETIDLSVRLYSHPLISTLQVALGIYITLSISQLIKQQEMLRRPLIYIGSGSLFILLFHNFSQIRISGILLHLGYNNQTSNIVGFLAGIIFPLIFWEFVKQQRLLSAIFLPRTLHS